MEREAKAKESDLDLALGPRAQGKVGATVCGFDSGTEGEVIGREQWSAIHERHATGVSISALAREFDLDRKTVRGCLRQSTWQPYRRSRSESVLDAHRDWLVERAPQVHYSARILHQELRAARGFKGSYETVKLAVRPLRAEACLAGLTQRRFETAPGEQAQVDWGQVTVRFGAVRATVHVFVMTLGYSRRAYAEGFTNERMANLLAAHERAFAHFGGRCERVLYDRMRTVVLASPHDAAEVPRRPRLNPTFAAFADHWGFTPQLCRPYRAQTKGKVESGVKYVKRNFVPGRSFEDLDDFNRQLACWQAEVADLRQHGTTHQRPIERFADEASALAPVAGQASFLQAMVRTRVVAEDWLVSIDGNRYTVPYGLIGQTVEVVRAGGKWLIRHRGRLVAEHAVLAGRGQLSVRPEHGPGAAARNARRRHASQPEPGLAGELRRAPGELAVEIRDLAIYERLLAEATRGNDMGGAR